MCFKCYLTRRPQETIETTDYYFNKHDNVPIGLSSNTWFYTNPMNTPRVIEMDYVLRFPDVNNNTKYNKPAVMF